jgi:hypothetical protein
MPLLLLPLLPAGGIVANNASGMCCGVAQNTYHTIADMRLLLADGTVLDTADENSCKAFLQVRSMWLRAPVIAHKLWVIKGGVLGAAAVVQGNLGLQMHASLGALLPCWPMIVHQHPLTC